MAEAETTHIETLIMPVSFYRKKAKKIVTLSRILEKTHKGQIPRDINTLLQLPGVGRKTANCVLMYGYAESALPIDTHIHRVSNRLGLVVTKQPDDTEKFLRKNIPKKFWIDITQLFLKLGKEICKPINPQCTKCPLKSLCTSIS
jgi:endonuclease-3